MKDSPSVATATGWALHISLLAIGILIGVALSTMIWLALVGKPTMATDGPLTQVAGNLEVQYMYETTPSGASGSTIEAVSIHFHPRYVIVTDVNGRSQLFATDRLRSFTYRALDVGSGS